jgi:hypothetical protein
MTLLQDDVPSGSQLKKMAKEGNHLRNHAKMTQLGMIKGYVNKPIEVVKLMNNVE